MVKCADCQDEEVLGYSVPDFIRATRPDGLGHIYFDGKEIAAFEEVLCDSCSKHLVQPEDEPERLMVFVWADRAWCVECFKRFVLCHMGKPGEEAAGGGSEDRPADAGAAVQENLKGGTLTQ